MTYQDEALFGNLVICRQVSNDQGKCLALGAVIVGVFSHHLGLKKQTGSDFFLDDSMLLALGGVNLGSGMEIRRDFLLRRLWDSQEVLNRVFDQIDQFFVFPIVLQKPANVIVFIIFRLLLRGSFGRFFQITRILLDRVLCGVFHCKPLVETLSGERLELGELEGALGLFGEKIGGLLEKESLLGGEGLVGAGEVQIESTLETLLLGSLDTQKLPLHLLSRQKLGRFENTFD